jgi:Family of unknown function (DUF6463)
MANAVVWFVFALGVAHMVFGLVRFKATLAEVVAAGFVDQFKHSELRRTAFWFLIFGPLVMLAGHVGVRAVAMGDLGLLRILGFYMLAIGLVGVLAFPKSPFWGSLVASPLLIAAGYGVLA